MTVDTDSKHEAVAVMSNSSSPSSTGTAAPAGDEAASTIMVNTNTTATTAGGGNATKTLTAATFPPPKTDKPRPHVCGTCQRSFARLEHLKRHERSHTKEKPFECPECTRCFARRDLLLRHQQKLHQTTTPSSRPRNRRESASGATPSASRVRKNSVAGPSAAAGNAAAASMRPRANTISHVDQAAIQMMATAAANVSRMPQAHSRHPSLIGLPTHHGLEAFGMSSALAHRGAQLGLPKLETNGINGVDFSNGLRTAPVMPFAPEFDMEGLFFGASSGSTINPNALHYSDSPPSLAMGPLSPFSHGLPDVSSNSQQLDDGFDWVTGFDHQMSFNTPADNAVDGSSPSALSTTSQSGISDVMVDGSNHHTAAAATTSSMWQASIMGQPQLSNPFSLDIGGSVFPDLLNGAPLSPQPSSAKTLADSYFSTPPPSLSSVSPPVMSGHAQNLNQALNFGGAGPETPSSMNGALSASQASQIGTRRYSIATPAPPPLAAAQPSSTTLGSSVDNPSFTGPGPSSSGLGAPDPSCSLSSTQDLRRYVGAYLRYFHPHLPFLHVPTLSFEVSAQSLANGRNSGIGGSGCLLLGMAAVGALFEHEHQVSMELFGLTKKMIQLCLDERRKANVRKAESIRRTFVSHQASQPPQDKTAETPVWLVQAMLLSIVYGHNCGDKRAAEIAATHSAALVSLAQGAGMLRAPPADPAVGGDVEMADAGGTAAWAEPASGDGNKERAEWLRWAAAEERKRTLYAVFVMSSLLVSAYNHQPALTNSEIPLDLPCDEELFAAESAAAFRARGGVAAANRNRMTFHEALGRLLRANEKPQQPSLSDLHQRPFGSAVHPRDLPKSDMTPSSFGCLVLINALHNYIWETRQRHHNAAWTNAETEKMRRHIEPALRAWHAAWASNPQHSAERPNPHGLGPLSADCIPLLDLAYVRLYVNLSSSKEKFVQRDWDGMVDELAQGSEIIQHAERSPSPMAGPMAVESSAASGARADASANGPTPDPSSLAFGSPKLQHVGTPGAIASSQHVPSAQASASSSPSMSRREKHLRKAAFFAAESLCTLDRLNITFATLTSRELPLHATLCVFDCVQVLAEWVASLQDRIGRYLGILGRDDVDLSQVPAVVLLEDEDAKLLGKVDTIIRGAKAKMGSDAAHGDVLASNADNKRRIHAREGYASDLLRVTAHMFDRSAVWPVTRLITSCLETHASRMRARAEKSILAAE
ncbi:hypothetical protein VTJ83DRAFT_1336 [Remersonia thermophila]|uniref:C2H2-type domain-containing protein n=1 Tax=Remersonia thermophila TaxID=72144 RepID=A0ABR4DPE0_9PEZI